jgi:glycosyltransferase involved in cell wall biosynthesis
MELRSKIPNASNQLKLLIAAHIGEPIGGVSIFYETLLKSKLKTQVNLNFVDTSEGGLAFSERGNWSFKNYCNSLTNIIRFTATLLKSSPDIVDIATAYNPSFYKNSVLITLARILGKKVVVQPHCSYKRFLPDPNSFSGRYIVFILKHCQGVVVLSKEWEDLKKLIPDLPISYIPNAIDVQSYVVIERKTHTKDKKIRFLYMGHIGREKGCIEIVEAARELKERFGNGFIVNFVGETLKKGELAEIKQLVDDFNCADVVKFHAPEYKSAKIERFSNSDVLLLPSYHEGMPMSVIEAMAAGMPVIATRVGGIPELVIEGETGFLVEPKDITRLIDAMEKFIGEPDLIYKMGKRGRKKAIDEFDIDIKVNKMIGFYKTILDKQS